MDVIQQNVIHEFEQTYSEAPAYVVRAPGRVNLIGEHTDYNDGFVLPLAIDRAFWIALRPRADRQIRIKLLDFDQDNLFTLDHLNKVDDEPIEYIKGVAWALEQAGYTLQGWEGVAQGNVPIGAGLSSSAALELATARAFNVVSGFAWDAALMAKAGQKAENGWVGVNCGIMDQMISAAGVANSALLIDCRSLETTPAPFPPGTVVIVLDTGTRRGLVGSAYNERRSQCEAAARFFGVPALRDVNIAQFEEKADGLDDVTRHRARHVITENDRTVAAKDAMFAGDAVRLGQLMNASHISMRDDFEISTPALNAMVECAQAHSACYGARMTGGGFGGAAVALIKIEAVDDFVETVARCYQDATGNTPQVYICHATNGAEIVTS
ncbi:MAG TPA: galactokinase [Phototrophicaceae bacterium]|jgi:galactokinase|nr:galactokinase [Phototrophicaceae bacterium]